MRDAATDYPSRTRQQLAGRKLHARGLHGGFKGEVGETDGSIGNALVVATDCVTAFYAVLRDPARHQPFWMCEFASEGCCRPVFRGRLVKPAAPNFPQH